MKTSPSKGFFKVCRPGRAVHHLMNGGQPARDRLTRRCSRRAAPEALGQSRRKDRARLAAERRSLGVSGTLRTRDDDSKIRSCGCGRRSLEDKQPGHGVLVREPSFRIVAHDGAWHVPADRARTRGAPANVAATKNAATTGRRIMRPSVNRVSLSISLPPSSHEEHQDIGHEDHEEHEVCGMSATKSTKHEDVKARRHFGDRTSPSGAKRTRSPGRRHHEFKHVVTAFLWACRAASRRERRPGAYTYKTDHADS